MAGTTTNYGISYPTSTDLVKDGAAAIQTVATGFDTVDGGRNCAGLVFIKAQTIGSAVASVTVTSAFSTTYDAYKIVITGGVGSTSAFISLALGSVATGYYASGGSTTYTGTSGTYTTNNGTSWGNVGYGTTDSIYLDVDISQPFLAKNKFIAGRQVNATSTAFINGYSSNTASQTAFTITPTSGTFTGGTIAVYGYRKAI
jgi:hypothetical protein